MTKKWIAVIAAAGWYGVLDLSLQRVYNIKLPHKLPETLMHFDGETILERLIRQCKQNGALEVYVGVGTQGSTSEIWEKKALQSGYKIENGGTPWTAKRWDYLKSLPCKLIPIDDWQNYCANDTFIHILNKVDIEFDEVLLSYGDYCFTDEAFKFLLSIPKPSLYYFHFLERIGWLTPKTISVFIDLIKNKRNRSNYGYPGNFKLDKEEWSKRGIKYLEYDDFINKKSSGKEFPGWYEISMENKRYENYIKMQEVVKTENNHWNIYKNFVEKNGTF